MTTQPNLDEILEVSHQTMRNAYGALSDNKAKIAAANEATKAAIIAWALEIVGEEFVESNANTVYLETNDPRIKARVELRQKLRTAFREAGK